MLLPPATLFGLLGLCLKPGVPVNVDHATFLGNDQANAVGKLRGVFIGLQTELPTEIRLVILLKAIVTDFSGHGWQVPDVADDGPAGDHVVDVGRHRWLMAPKGIAEHGVVTDGHRVDGTVQLEAALLEHHDHRIVDTSTCKDITRSSSSKLRTSTRRNADLRGR